jgi:hypothetical protein
MIEIKLNIKVAKNIFKSYELWEKNINNESK